jgi:hypothetical protein
MMGVQTWWQSLLDWWHSLFASSSKTKKQRWVAVDGTVMETQKLPTYLVQPDDPPRPHTMYSYLTAQDAFGRWIREPIEYDGYFIGIDPELTFLNWHTTQAAHVWGQRILAGNARAAVKLQIRLDQAAERKAQHDKEREKEKEKQP